MLKRAYITVEEHASPWKILLPSRFVYCFKIPQCFKKYKVQKSQLNIKWSPIARLSRSINESMMYSILQWKKPFRKVSATQSLGCGWLGFEICPPNSTPLLSPWISKSFGTLKTVITNWWIWITNNSKKLWRFYGDIKRKKAE